MKKLMRSVLLICLVSFLQSGCAVGMLWSFSTDTESFYPAPGIKDINLQKTDFTKHDISSIWGEPKRKLTDGSKETWIYNHDLAWRGITPIFLIPIPLMLPVGLNEKGFEFDGDRLTHSWNEFGMLGGGYCIFIFPTRVGAPGPCQSAKQLRGAKDFIRDASP